MAHTEIKTFQFGKTLQVKAEVLKARTPDELHAQDEYPYQDIVGIKQVYYNDGIDDPEWKMLEPGTDVGELFRQVKALEAQLEAAKTQTRTLERKLQSLGVVVDEEGSQSSGESSVASRQSSGVSSEAGRQSSGESSDESSEAGRQSSGESSGESSQPIRTQILSMFVENVERSTQEIVEAIDAHPVRIKQVLTEMCNASEIVRVRRGVYVKAPTT